MQITSLRRVFWLIIITLLVLVGCETTENATPTAPPPTAIAKNPPQVWIDQPIPGQILVLHELPDEVIAHAAGLGGNAQLQVRDGQDALLATVNLGSPSEVLDTGERLSRYEGEWQSALQSLLANMPNVQTLKLVILVDGVESAPVIFTILRESETPTITPTGTLTPTATLTSTSTPTDTPTATDTPTHTSMPTDTPTFTPTLTLTETPTPTLTPTFTASPTEFIEPPRAPDVPYFPKDELPCEITPLADTVVQGRVGPGSHRGVRYFLEAPDSYEGIAYNDDFGLWWLIRFNAREALWVDDLLVNRTGSCFSLPYEEAPDVVIPQPPSNNRPPDTAPGEPVIYYFYADTTTLPTYLNGTLSYCTNLHWDVEYVDGVYLNGEGVGGENETRQVCMSPNNNSQDYTLEIYKDGAIADSRTVTLMIGSGGGVSPTPTSPPACRYVSRSVFPSGWGSVSISSPNCNSGYASGSVVSVQAIPANNSIGFDGWTGSCPVVSSNSSITYFVINGSCSVTANFFAIIE